MFLSFQQVNVSSSVLTVSALTVPAKATGVELQADTSPIRYTMDGVTAPSTTAGMVLLVTEPPRYFEIVDLNKIKFIRSGGSDGKLNLHYSAGRDI